MKELNIGDEIDFRYCGTIKSGEIADIDGDKLFIRIPSA